MGHQSADCLLAAGNVFQRSVFLVTSTSSHWVSLCCVCFVHEASSLWSHVEVILVFFAWNMPFLCDSNKNALAHVLRKEKTGVATTLASPEVFQSSRWRLVSKCWRHQTAWGFLFWCVRGSGSSYLFANKLAVLLWRLQTWSSHSLAFQVLTLSISTHNQKPLVFFDEIWSEIFWTTVLRRGTTACGGMSSLQ